MATTLQYLQLRGDGVEQCAQVRGSLSAEVWESINATRESSCEPCQGRAGRTRQRRLSKWVKERVHLFRGAVIGTLLRNDALSFIGIGTLDRARLRHHPAAAD
ncbi:alpha-E domain-containing protein [Klebsiella variicola subsp. variicola]|nr:alpha-E domain-containing protein [Klebsiella variicola subsp. variicola]